MCKKYMQCKIKRQTLFIKSTLVYTLLGFRSFEDCVIHPENKISPLCRCLAGGMDV